MKNEINSNQEEFNFEEPAKSEPASEADEKVYPLGKPGIIMERQPACPLCQDEEGISCGRCNKGKKRKK